MKTLDELYFTWLYSQYADVMVVDPAETFWDLSAALYQIEFVPVVRNDDSRASDGVELRQLFVDEEGIFEVDPDWMEQPCSFLEMLVALAKRAAFISRHDNYVDWFWEIMTNVGLSGCNDTYNRNIKRIVAEVAQQINDRTYAYDGTGGMFPLRRTHIDQTKVEIWYQLNAYIMENE